MNHRLIFGHSGYDDKSHEEWFSRLSDSVTDALHPISNKQLKLTQAEVPNLLTYSDPNTLIVLLGSPYHLDTEDSGVESFSMQRFAADILGNGTSALQNLGGSFALVAFLKQDSKLIIAVDRFSIENLYYVSNNRGIAFSNTTSLLSSHPRVSNEFSRQSIFDYLYFHCVPSPEVGFKNIQRLVPGNFLLVSKNQIKTGCYWEPTYSQDTKPDPTALQTLLKTAVKRRMRNVPTACFLSGGLDSSTIAGFCNEVSQSDITAVTIGFDADGYDETEFAMAVAKHYQIKHETYRVTPADIVTSLPEIATSFDAPFGNASAVPTYFCSRLAKQIGAQQIYAGDGGDELFGGNTRYAKQLMFESYSKIPLVIRKNLIEPTNRGVESLISNPISRKIANYIAQTEIQLPERTQTYNLLNRIDYRQCLHEDYLASISVKEPGRILGEIYSAGTLPTQALNRLLKLDWRLTLADSDLMKVTKMSALAGINVEFPMLDETVFDFAAGLPLNEKVRGRDLRPFYRKTFSHMLPSSTLNKSKHGFGLPFGVWLEQNNELMEMSMESLRYLETVGIVKRDFHVNFFKTLLPQHPDYYGVFLWILVSLALWLQNRRVSLS